MATIRFWQQDDGDYWVEADDGSFKGVMSPGELGAAQGKMPDKVWSHEVGPPPKQIGWTVREYTGVEVYRPPSGLTLKEVKDRSKWPPDFKLVPVKAEKLKVGDPLLVPGPFGGMYLGTVRGDRDGNPYFLSEGGSLHGFLEFGTDDRECWVCAGFGNLDAIRSLEVKR